MKLTFLSLFTLVICIGVKGQDFTIDTTNTIQRDIYLPDNPMQFTQEQRIYFYDGKNKTVIDSTAFYRRKYKHFMALYTNSIGYKEVTRMGDSCRRYYQLLNRKK